MADDGVSEVCDLGEVAAVRADREDVADAALLVVDSPEGDQVVGRPIWWTTGAQLPGRQIVVRPLPSTLITNRARPLAGLPDADTKSENTRRLPSGDQATPLRSAE